MTIRAFALHIRRAIIIPRALQYFGNLIFLLNYKATGSSNLSVSSLLFYDIAVNKTWAMATQSKQRDLNGAL